MSYTRGHNTSSNQQPESFAYKNSVFNFVGVLTRTERLASSNFCHLLITSANSLDPAHDQQNVNPNLDLNPLTL